MAKPSFIELSEEDRIPILYEDRSVMAIDKPRGWMLVPLSWQKTNRNLQAAITSSVAGGDYWARSRNLKYLRHVHRLDADTSGILLLAKSPGALDTFSDLFESRKMDKVYFAVVHGVPQQKEWTCRQSLSPNPSEIGSMIVDAEGGKEAETHFRVLASRDHSRGAALTLIEAVPITGRTHQIRVHLAESGHPVAGDPLYGLPQKGSRHAKASAANPPLGLRAISLSYIEPFIKRLIQIRAPTEEFLREFQFESIPKS